MDELSEIRRIAFEAYKKNDTEGLIKAIRMLEENYPDRFQMLMFELENMTPLQ